MTLRAGRPDRRSAAARAYRSLYKTPEWRKLRAHQLAIEPWCRRCSSMGRMTLASTVDHIIPHRGDRGLFFDPSNLQSICDPCHNSAKQSEERRGYSTQIGADGYPVDPVTPRMREGGGQEILRPPAPGPAALADFLVRQAKIPETRR